MSVTFVEPSWLARPATSSQEAVSLTHIDSLQTGEARLGPTRRA